MYRFLPKWLPHPRLDTTPTIPARGAPALMVPVLVLLITGTPPPPIFAHERAAHPNPSPRVSAEESPETSPAIGPGAGAEVCALRGRVRSTTDDAISGATVTVLPDGARTTTDAAGRLCLKTLQSGPRRLLVVAEGFVVVTATRTAKRLQEVPIQLQIVDREKIESVVARNLAEAVEWTSGIRVESNCQNCNESKIRMLGLEGGYSQILIDGQPTVSSLALVYGIEQLPARLIDSIEVVKGGGSALYGAGAVAGVINLIPHQPSETGARSSCASETCPVRRTAPSTVSWTGPRRTAAGPSRSTHSAIGWTRWMSTATASRR